MNSFWIGFEKEAAGEPVIKNVVGIGHGYLKNMAAQMPKIKNKVKAAVKSVAPSTPSTFDPKHIPRSAWKEALGS
jgi:hypothetical protein